MCPHCENKQAKPVLRKWQDGKFDWMCNNCGRQVEPPADQSLARFDNSWLDIPAKMTPVSLTFPKALSYEKWAEIGPRVARIKRFTSWALGDWLCYGERAYGETYSQACDATGLEVQYLMILKHVAARVETSRRRENLSWSHHKAVASLEPAEQERFLSESEKNNWTREELAEALRGFKNLVPDKISNDTFQALSENDPPVEEPPDPPEFEPADEPEPGNGTVTERTKRPSFSPKPLADFPLPPKLDANPRRCTASCCQPDGLDIEGPWNTHDAQQLLDGKGFEYGFFREHHTKLLKLFAETYHLPALQRLHGGLGRSAINIPAHRAYRGIGQERN